MILVPCRECQSPIDLDYEADAPEPQTGYVGGFWLIDPPSRCSACGWSTEVADMKRRAIAAVEELRRTSP